MTQVETIKQVDDEEALPGLKNQLAEAGRLCLLEELCAGIAHELNNPLAIIAGSIRNSREMLARSSEPATPMLQEVLKRLEYIDDASSRISQIVRNVLIFARQQEHSLVPFDLKITLEKALERLRESLGNEHVQLHCLLPTDPFLIKGDADGMLQAFVNILANARDALAANRDGAPRLLTISVQRLPEHRIEISFRDSGIGMDAQTLSRIFYPFFTTKDIGKGTGLGLAISHGIITQHKGQIFCDSKPGQGTLVRVILPQLVETTAALRA